MLKKREAPFERLWTMIEEIYRYTIQICHNLNTMNLSVDYLTLYLLAGVFKFWTCIAKISILK